ncbi:GNAT family N-acetyltransferase [Kibdelosporangium lantanae]
MDHLGATLRLATPSDAPEIGALMRASVYDLFPGFYAEATSRSAAEYITKPDMALISDGTYYVHEAGGEVVACGGWSKRAKLYVGGAVQEDDDRIINPATEAARIRAMFVRADWTRRGLARAILTACENAARDAGFSEMTLLATLPGVPLYLAYGFREIERYEVELPDGVPMEGVVMTRAITTADPARVSGI